MIGEAGPSPWISAIVWSGMHVGTALIQERDASCAL